MTTLTARARAPLRLGLAGGGTDLSPYCDLYGGAVLNVAIARFAHASLTLGDGGKSGGGRGTPVVLRACDLNHREDCEVDLGALDGAGPIASGGGLGLHRAVCRRVARDHLHGVLPPLTLETQIDAPPGSGLGSSSALVVAMVEAFRVAFDLPLGRYDVARLAFEIERHDLGLAGGRQDQYAAAFGGVNFIEFLSGERVVVNPLRLPGGVREELEAQLVVAFSGQSRSSDAIISDQIAHVADRDEAAMEGMHRLKEDAFEMKLALLQADFVRVAQIMDRSWAAKKATSNRITNDTIEALWAAAHAAGARSGKVSGAGGGGFLMFLCDPVKRADVMRALRALGGDPSTVSFQHEGVEAWTVPRHASGARSAATARAGS